MKFIEDKIFWERLLKRCKKDVPGWFYNSLPKFFSCDPYIIDSENFILELLIGKTIQALEIIEAIYPLYIFNEGFGGWKGLKDETSVLQLENLEELEKVLRKNIYFEEPDGYGDNYNITDENLDWFIVFCHHNDWHFYAPREIVEKIRMKLH